MNLHPRIANTVLLCQFQGTLADSGGNALNLSPIDAFSNAPRPAGEQYTTIDTCTQGFLYDGSTKLIAPLSATLQLTGERTFEWVMKMVSTNEQAFMACADPAGRSGGNGADRIGSVYTYLWDATNSAAYFSKTMGSNIPSAHYGDFTGTNNGNWGFNGFHHYAFRTQTIAGTLTASVFVDGAKIIPDVADLGTSATGIERLYIGGFEGAGENLATNSIMASLRILSYARSDAAIAADANFVLGACGGTPVYPVTDALGPDDGAQGSGATGNIVYDGLAAAQFGLSLQQGPKS